MEYGFKTVFHHEAESGEARPLADPDSAAFHPHPRKAENLGKLQRNERNGHPLQWSQSRFMEQNGCVFTVNLYHFRYI